MDGGGYLNDRERESFCPLHFPSNRSIFEFPGQNKWNPIGRIINELADLVGANTTFMSDFGRRVQELNESLEAAPEYQAFREKLVEYSRDHLGVRGDSIDVQLGLVDPRHILKTLQVFEADGNALYNVADGGQGVQSSVTMAALRAFASVQGGRFFVIADEPEAYLHPLAQQALCSVFEELAAGGTQILLTTHSPHFISVDHMEGLHKVWMNNNRTKTCPFDMDGLLLRRVQRDTERGTPEGIKSRLSKTLTLEAREALFGQLTVLCEGDTEALSLPIWAEIGGHDFSKLGIAVVQSQGKSSMIHLAEFFASFNVPTYLLFDNDSNVPRTEDRVKHVEHNRYLLYFSGAPLIDYPPTGANAAHAVFDPNYERVMRGDPAYSIIETDVNEELGLEPGSSKGIRARMVAIKYREQHLPPPQIIADIVASIVAFRTGTMAPGSPSTTPGTSGSNSAPGPSGGTMSGGAH